MFQLTCCKNQFIVRFLAGPVAEPPETPTHLSMLSDSVMRTPALNELSDDHEEGGYHQMNQLLALKCENLYMSVI